MQARVTGAVGHRQHRHAGAFAYSSRAVERERPEVRRRPDEDDQEQHQRLGGTSPVTAAQPSTGGIAPEAPPITMFCGVAGFSSTV